MDILNTIIDFLAEVLNFLNKYKTNKRSKIVTITYPNITFTIARYAIMKADKSRNFQEKVLDL